MTNRSTVSPAFLLALAVVLGVVVVGFVTLAAVLTPGSAVRATVSDVLEVEVAED